MNGAGKMNIVITAAGKGKRLKNTGSSLPKVIFPVNSRPMIYWALDSLSPICNLNEAVIVCLKEDVVQHSIDQIIRNYGVRPRYKLLKHTTKGQAESVWEARHMLQLDEPLLIYNCDTYMRLTHNTNLYNGNKSTDGIISVFNSQDPGLSYVRTNETGEVIVVKEKEIISNYASTGLYYFAKAKYFMDAFEEAKALEDMSNGEYYVAPLYNRLITKRYHIHIEEAEACYPLGTLEQIKQFESIYSDSRGEI